MFQSIFYFWIYIQNCGGSLDIFQHTHYEIWSETAKVIQMISFVRDMAHEKTVQFQSHMNSPSLIK